MPETFPAPDQGANIDRCWTCRSMFMQAWGNYGTAWAVVHQWLGVQPDLGRGALAIVPQVPPGQPHVAGRSIRLGGGSVDVRASVAGGRYLTAARVSRGVGAHRVTLGAVLPRGATPGSVRLDGHPVAYAVATTNRGVEVRVRATAGRHVLSVTG
jgi:hypothetical protein